MKKLIILFITFYITIFCNCTIVSVNYDKIPKELISKITLPDTLQNYDSKEEFLTYIFTGIGICQLFKNDIDNLPTNLVDTCIKRALKYKDFDELAWEEDPITCVLNDKCSNDHAGFLGYLNYLLSVYTYYHPSNIYAGLNNKISHKFLKKFKDFEVLETYPNQSFSSDIAVCMNSVEIWYRSANMYNNPFVRNYYSWFNEKYLVDNKYYRNTLNDIENFDSRGSVTASVLYYTYIIYPEKTRHIYDNFLKVSLDTTNSIIGIKEFLYNDTFDFVYFDPTSGIVLQNIGSVASGFTLGYAILCKDKKIAKNLTESKNTFYSLIAMEILPYTSTYLDKAVLFALTNPVTFIRN